MGITRPKQTKIEKLLAQRKLSGHDLQAGLLLKEMVVARLAGKQIAFGDGSQDYANLELFQGEQRLGFMEKHNHRLKLYKVHDGVKTFSETTKTFCEGGAMKVATAGGILAEFAPPIKAALRLGQLAWFAKDSLTDTGDKATIKRAAAGFLRLAEQVAEANRDINDNPFYGFGDYRHSWVVQRSLEYLIDKFKRHQKRAVADGVETAANTAAAIVTAALAAGGIAFLPFGAVVAGGGALFAAHRLRRRIKHYGKNVEQLEAIKTEWLRRVQLAPTETPLSGEVNPTFAYIIPQQDHMTGFYKKSLTHKKATAGDWARATFAMYLYYNCLKSDAEPGFKVASAFALVIFQGTLIPKSVPTSKKVVENGVEAAGMVLDHGVLGVINKLRQLQVH